MKSNANPDRALPLRLVLVVPFVLQIFATVGLTGYLSLQNGQKAVNDVSSQWEHLIFVKTLLLDLSF